jgi:hypothetical protein
MKVVSPMDALFPALTICPNFNSAYNEKALKETIMQSVNALLLISESNAFIVLLSGTYKACLDVMVDRAKSSHRFRPSKLSQAESLLYRQIGYFTYTCTCNKSAYNFVNARILAIRAPIKQYLESFKGPVVPLHIRYTVNLRKNHAKMT